MMKKFFFLTIGILIVLLIYLFSNYNSLVSTSQEVDASWAQVQNVYQRRADLIPNLVQTVQGAANFEKSTLVQVVNARASVGKVAINPGQAPTDANQLLEFQKAQGQLSNALSHLLVVSERYPDLKANSNFRDLQVQIEGSENRIAVERERFNVAVQGYNTLIRSVPTVFFSRILGFLPRPYFKSTAEAEKAPHVNFNFNTTTQ